MKILERYQLAKEIVTVVGEKITGLHSGQLLVGYKDGQAQDPVTNLDELAQNMIIQSILEVFNSDQIYAEENNKQQANLDSDNLWIIDPIDGTANFMHGLPLWGISIAFAQKGQVIFGVVYCPEIQKMYEAFEGKGAFLNAKPIYVSKIDNLEHALITTGLTHQLKNQPVQKELIMELFNRLFEKTQRVRILGSSVLQICEVAAGHSEAFIGTGLKPWDFAAAAKILSEAGGKTTNFNQHEASLSNQDLICSNSLIHKQLSSLLN